MCTIARPRKLAFDRQHGRCIYCGLPMWIVSAAELTSKFAISHAQARRLQCTAEHVIAKCDGGSNAAANIAASCYHCNQGRHARKFPLSSEEFKKHVRSRMAAGRWHSRYVLRAAATALHDDAIRTPLTVHTPHTARVCATMIILWGRPGFDVGCKAAQGIPRAGHLVNTT